MKHSARHYKKKKNIYIYIIFFLCRADLVFFWVVPGGNRECWAAPPGAAHRSYNPD